MSLLHCQNVKKTYKTRFTNKAVEALKGINFCVDKGEFIAIMGESGSGKTTLLNCLATLDKPTEGNIILDNQDLTLLNPSQASLFRREKLGFVFQDFNLLESMSVEENIVLPLVLNKKTIKEMNRNLVPLTQKLGIYSLIKKYPYELSGGEKQRVAIARALITQPSLLLADEPSGALDSKTSRELFNLFQDFNQMGQTILMVTHSAFAASFTNRILVLKDGLIIKEINRHGLNNHDFLNVITSQLG